MRVRSKERELSTQHREKHLYGLVLVCGFTIRHSKSFTVGMESLTVRELILICCLWVRVELIHMQHNNQGGEVGEPEKI